MTRCNSILAKYMWLIPVVWSINNGKRSKRDIAASLGVSRRFVSSALYHMRMTGLIDENGKLDVSCNSINIKRRGRWFSCIIGGTVIVVHLTRRRAHYYTIPRKTLEKAVVNGCQESSKLCNRINKALSILGKIGLEGAGLEE